MTSMRILPYTGAVAGPEPKVKGTTFRTTDACFKELRGEEAWAKAHALMPEEVREAYRTGAILSGGWYPLSWYREMFRAYAAATNEGPELSRTLGYRSARIDFKRDRKSTRLNSSHE